MVLENENFSLRNQVQSLTRDVHALERRVKMVEDEAALLQARLDALQVRYNEALTDLRVLRLKVQSFNLDYSGWLHNLNQQNQMMTTQLQVAYDIFPKRGWKTWETSVFGLLPSDFIKNGRPFRDWYQRIEPGSLELEFFADVPDPPVRYGTMPIPWRYWVYWNEQPPKPGPWGLLAGYRNWLENHPSWSAPLPPWVLTAYTTVLDKVTSFVRASAVIVDQYDISIVEQSPTPVVPN